MVDKEVKKEVLKEEIANEVKTDVLKEDVSQKRDINEVVVAGQERLNKTQGIHQQQQQPRGLLSPSLTIPFPRAAIPSPIPSPGTPASLYSQPGVTPISPPAIPHTQSTPSPLGFLVGITNTPSPIPSVQVGASVVDRSSALATSHPYHQASSFNQLNKLASEKQNTLAGTLGHTPPSPIVIQPSQAGHSPNPNVPHSTIASTPPVGGAMNGPLTPQTVPNPGQINPALSSTPNGQDVQNNNTVKPKSCAGCGARICDRFLLHAMDRYWHTGCLKCSCCHAQLGEIGTTCYAKAGMILCKNDYIRLFGSSGTCSACGQGIPASELVMRAQTNVYHLNCFTCVACNCRLSPGDRYSLFNGSIICELDYPKVLKGHTQIPLRSSHKVC